MANRLLTPKEAAERMRPFVEAMLEAKVAEFVKSNPGVPYDVFLVPASGREMHGHFVVEASTSAKEVK